MRIVFYNADTVSKVDSLKRLFNDCILPGTGIELVEANQHTLQQQLTPDARIFVMPGARESNAYRNEITGANFDRLVRRIDDGMHVLGICAGAYVLARNFEYRVYDEKTGRLNEVRQVSSSLGLVNVKAFGPDQRLYTARPREEGNPWSVYSLAEVEFQEDGRPVTAALAISRAPSFTEPHPAQCRVMARYVATGDAAMVGFRLGQGGGVLVGPAIEVGGRNLRSYVHPRHEENPHSKAIIDRLDKAAPAWGRLVAQTFRALLPGEERVHRVIAENLRHGLALRSGSGLAGGGRLAPDA